MQLLGSLRPATAMAPGQPARRDYEYARCGTANVFCVVEPQTGRHQTHATKNRTAAKFARALKRIAQSYPAARTIHLVLDNLNTHREKSLTATFGAQAGHRLWRRVASARWKRWNMPLNRPKQRIISEFGDRDFVDLRTAQLEQVRR